MRTPGAKQVRGRALGAGALGAALLATACSADQPPPAPRTTSRAAPSTAPAPSSAAASAATSRAPDGTAPLTGLPATPALLAGPVLAVKVDNVPAALPQAGLDAADLVIEEPVEGGLTRLMAVFHSRTTGRVGPVRSARVSDAGLVQALGGGGLAFSGASGASLRWLRREPRVTLVMPSGWTWRRDSRRSAPHNLYLHEQAEYGRYAARLPGPARRQFSFGPAAAGGTPTSSAQVRFQAASAGWTWGGRDWQRSQQGRADKLETGRRISAANVVVLQVRTTTDKRFHDKNGASTPIMDLTSGGPGWLLRDGRSYRGSWQRGPDGRFTLLAADRTEIPLKPGSTWIELLPAPAAPTLR